VQNSSEKMKLDDCVCIIKPVRQVQDSDLIDGLSVVLYYGAPDRRTFSDSTRVVSIVRGLKRLTAVAVASSFGK